MVQQTTVVFFLFVILGTISCQKYKVVQTPVGKIRGLAETIGDKKIYNFLGIPYAKPPVGELRFRKPQPYGSWEYTLDATKDTSPCMQPVKFTPIDLITSNRVSEDCLFLNIHVPQDVPMSGNRDVMIWIHGGGFLIGQGSWYNTSFLALNGDVIVVTINYRLGMFGFLSTFDDAARGNFGLWDQILAMQWVRSNIAGFGGNPSSITIFGESAGGMSVSYQSIIPYNKGLFQRAIAQSGVSLSTPLPTDNNKLFNFLLQEKFCSDFEMRNTYSLVQCLRQKSADDIQNIGGAFMMGEMMNMDMGILFGPCIDGELFRLDPVELLKDNDSEEYKFFRSLDYMAGTMDNEGAVMLQTMQVLDMQYQINSAEGIPTKILRDKFAPTYAIRYFHNSPGTAKALCDKYTVDGGEKENIGEQANQIFNMISDLFFISPTVQTLNAHSERNTERSTYQFLFTRHLDNYLGVIPLPSWCKGAAHGSELMYMFDLEKMAQMGRQTLLDEDYRLQEHMVKYWSNFAKTGNPNSESLPEWKQYGNDRNFLRLDHVIKSDKEVFADRMNFIQKEIPKIIEREKTSKHEEL